nr:DUF3987 domain-containing protein [Geotalea toluenoxydans]
MNGNEDIEQQFRDAMQAAGCEHPGQIIMDGQYHRYALPGDKSNSKNGYYQAFPDGNPTIVFGSWKKDGKGAWNKWSLKEHRSLTPEESSTYKRNIEAAKAVREAELQRRQAECRKKSTELWNAASPTVAANHAYLVKKGIKPYGARQLKESLLIPVRDVDGVLHGLQFVTGAGSKTFKSGTAITGNYHAIGKPSGVLLVCEGWATGCTLHQVTGHAVACAFSAGNLKPVAEVLRKKYPDLQMIIVADNDRHTDGNPGLTKATEAVKAVNALSAVPVFSNPESKGTDANDLANEESPEAVKAIIEAAQAISTPAPVPDSPLNAKIESPVEKTAADKAPAETRSEESSAETEGTHGDTWDAPLLFGEIDTPEIPAHLLPGYLGEFCQAVSDATQTPPGLAVMFALAAVAACLAKRFEVSPYGDEYCEPVNVWTVTALDPGNRKTAVKTAITAPLTEWEQEEAARLRPDIKRIKHQREINQKAIDQIKARAAKADTSAAGRDDLLKEITEIEEDTPDELIAPRLWTDDTTPERLQSLLLDHGERMALLSDESGVFEVMGGLYSGGKANLNVFLQGHAGSSVRVDRQGRTVMLHKPALTFGLTVQPEIIADLGKGNKTCFRGNGTLARFLYSLPKSRIGTRDVTQRVVITKEVKEAYRTGIMKLLDIEPDLDSKGQEKARVLTLSTEALEVWHQFSQFIEDKQGPDGEFYSFQDWTSKLPGAAFVLPDCFMWWSMEQKFPPSTLKPSNVHLTCVKFLSAMPGQPLKPWGVSRRKMMRRLCFAGSSPPGNNHSGRMRR